MKVRVVTAVALFLASGALAQESGLGEHDSPDVIGAGSSPPEIDNSSRGSPSFDPMIDRLDRRDEQPPQEVQAASADPEREPASMTRVLVSLTIYALKQSFPDEPAPTREEVEQAWADLDEKGMDGLTARQQRIIDPPIESFP